MGISGIDVAPVEQRLKRSIVRPPSFFHMSVIEWPIKIPLSIGPKEIVVENVLDLHPTCFITRHRRYMFGLQS